MNKVAFKVLGCLLMMLASSMNASERRPLQQKTQGQSNIPSQVLVQQKDLDRSTQTVAQSNLESERALFAKRLKELEMQRILQAQESDAKSQQLERLRLRNEIYCAIIGFSVGFLPFIPFVFSGGAARSLSANSTNF